MTEHALSVAASNEWPYRFEVLTSQSLFVDESYQRPLSRFVKDIVDDFDPGLVGILIVSERRGGKKYAIIDGQTRWVAMKQLGQLQVPCLVYSGLSRAEEASLFSRFQTERRSMRAFHRFRAACVAGDESALEVQKITEGCGFTLADSPGVDVIAAVSALEAAHKRGVLERTLTIIYTAWTRRNRAASGEVIRGLAYYLQRAEDVDDTRLANHLALVSPPELKNRASQLREGRGHGGNSPRYMAEAIEAIYGRKPKVAT